jgi:hypothetical protein
MNPSKGEKAKKTITQSDQMQQLSMLLAQNQGTKASGSFLNLISFLNTQWVLDSGATDHMIGNRNILETFNKFSTKQYVTVVNGEKMEILGDGSITIFLRKVSNVFLVKDCASNLLSISRITRELECELIFSSKSVILQKLISKKVIGDGSLKNRFYYLNKKKFNLNSRKEEKLSTLWH